MKLIYIEWCDALTNPNWFEKQEALDWAEDEEYGNWIVREVGWLLKDSKEMIVIASGWNKYEDKFVNLHKIPKTWIRKRKILKV